MTSTKKSIVIGIGYIIYSAFSWLVATIIPPILPGIQLKLCDCPENTVVGVMMYPVSVIVAMLGVFLSFHFQKKHTTLVSLMLGILFVIITQAVLTYFGLYVLMSWF